MGSRTLRGHGDRVTWQSSFSTEASSVCGCRVRELEKARFRKRTRPALYRNRSPLMRQISELLHLPKKRVSIYRHLCGKLLSSGGLFFSKVVRSSYLLKGGGKEFWRSGRGWTG